MPSLARIAMIGVRRRLGEIFQAAWTSDFPNFA
jgi:hypothetical protein